MQAIELLTLYGLDLKKAFGANLTKLRGNRSRLAVSVDTGIGVRTLVSMEDGESWPQFRNLMTLSDYYSVPAEQLLALTQLVIKPSATEALKIIAEAIQKAETIESSPQKRLLINKILARTAPFEDAEIEGILALVDDSPMSDSGKTLLDDEDDQEDADASKLRGK